MKRRAGRPFNEARVHRNEAGEVVEIWCWIGKHWQPPEAFQPDSKCRYTGRQRTCWACQVPYKKLWKRKRRMMKGAQAWLEHVKHVQAPVVVDTTPMERRIGLGRFRAPMLKSPKEPTEG